MIGLTLFTFVYILFFIRKCFFCIFCLYDYVQLDMVIIYVRRNVLRQIGKGKNQGCKRLKLSGHVIQNDQVFGAQNEKFQTQSIIFYIFKKIYHSIKVQEKRKPSFNLLFKSQNLKIFLFFNPILSRLMLFNQHSFFKLKSNFKTYQNKFVILSFIKNNFPSFLQYVKQSKQIFFILFNKTIQQIQKTFTIKKNLMKSVSIVYKRPNTDGIAPEFRPVKSIKRSVDEYLQKLKQKQQNHHNTKTFTISIRPNLNTAHTSRVTKLFEKNEITNTINIAKIKYSTENIFKHMTDHHQNTPIKKQNKFRSTFVKRSTHQGFYSLKGIKSNNHELFTQNKPNFITKKNSSQIKNTSKLVTLKKIKLTKPKTVLISVDFILNEFNFWAEEKVDQTAHKNWKILQEYSNIVWLTRRQNSFKKLQKYAKEYGLRLDGVYKIQPNKKTKTLLFSLSTFEKDFMSDSQFIRKQDVKKEVILINSLKVDTIKNIGYEEFYNLFPVSNQMRSVVHFIQIDMNDKHRFNNPLKILSKQKLPNPNQINHLFLQFHRENKKNVSETIRLCMGYEDEQQEEVKDQQIMEKYEEIKERFLNYFGNHLKLNLSKKVKADDTEQSIQYLIGDMLKRNFNLLSNYQRESQKITSKLQRLRLKQSQINAIPLNDEKNAENNALKNNFISTTRRISIDKLLTSKLAHQKPEYQLMRQKKLKSVEEQKYFFKDPVFLWRK